MEKKKFHFIQNGNTEYYIQNYNRTNRKLGERIGN